MKLYRIDMDAGPPKADLVAGQEIEWLMGHGFLVEVEPCMHGNYAGHIKPTVEWAGIGPSGDDWCLGAGLEEQ